MAGSCTGDGGVLLPPPPGHGTDDGPGPAASTAAAECRDPTDDGSGGLKFDVGGDSGGFDFPVSCDELARNVSNLGCEFWAVDLPNDWRGTDMSPPAAEQQFAVVVANASSLQPAIVSAFVGNETVPLEVATVDVEQVHVFELETASIDPERTSTDGVAYRIESDVPVTAYQFNPLDNSVEVYSNDASLLLPSHALDKDHVALTSDGIWLSMNRQDPTPVKAGAFVSVVGLRDDTRVDVVATAHSFGPVGGVVLDRGQVYTVISDRGLGVGNLTGTRVVADSPVAVFSGNVAAVEPTDSGECCADHLEEQLPPIAAWGTAYVVAPPPSVAGPGADAPAVYRIVAAFDDTSLGWCPARPQGAPTSLDAFESATFETDEPFVVRSDDPERPLAIAQFLESGEAVGASFIGDPALIVPAPAAQFRRKYVFAVPAAYASGNFVTIVTRGRGMVSLDGVVLDVAGFARAGVLDRDVYWYRHVQVFAGAHVVMGSVPIGITVVGYDRSVSYGFAGGAGLDVIAIPPAAG